MPPTNRLRHGLVPVLASVAVLAIACGEGTYPPVVTTVQIIPATRTLTAVGQTGQLTVTVQDQFGNPIGGKMVQWLSSAPSVATVDQATGLVTAVANGMTTITATVEFVTTTASVTVTQQSAKLAFIAVPFGGTAGRTLTPTVRVEIEDANGARVTNAQDAVTLAFGVNPSGAALVGATTVNAVGGIATFTGLAIDKAGTGYTLVASVTGLPNHTSIPLTVVASHGPFAQLSPGFFHTCGVTVAGPTYCWGGNSSGALGDGTTISRPHPERVTGSATFTAVTSGSNHSCGITAAGAAYCWGANSFGQLGDGSTSDRSSPTLVAGGLTFASVSAGFYHTCGVTTLGALYCWGYNSKGQLGDGSTADHSSPALVAGSVVFSTVSAGSASHTCGLTSTGGDVYCWGDNSLGALGDGTGADQPSPLLVADSITFAAVTVGEFHTCGATGSGVAYCWGSNSNGQIGDGTAGTGTNRLSPVLVTGGVTFAAVSPGGLHSCGTSSTNVAYCWGYGPFGQLGDGTGMDRSSPTPVTGGVAFATVISGATHTCALTLGGLAYCWGGNLTGQLGDGTTISRSAPVPVEP